MNPNMLDIMSLILGVCLFIIDVTLSASLPVTGNHTLIYDVMQNCFSVGELDISVDLNLTYPEAIKATEYRRDFRLPEDVFQARCDRKESNITLLSKDGVLEIHLILTLQDDDTSYAGLEVTNIQVHSRENKPEIDSKAPVILSKRGKSPKNRTLSYESSYNETVECNTKQQKVIFHSPRAQTAIVFSQVRLQPYSKFVRLDNGKGLICPVHQQSSTGATAHSEILIPLILAVALSVVILLIVIGYFVHKKIEGMGYTSM